MTPSTWPWYSQAVSAGELLAFTFSDEGSMRLSLPLVLDRMKISFPFAALDPLSRSPDLFGSNSPDFLFCFRLRTLSRRFVTCCLSPHAGLQYKSSGRNRSSILRVGSKKVWNLTFYFYFCQNSKDYICCGSAVHWAMTSGSLKKNLYWRLYL